MRLQTSTMWRALLLLCVIGAIAAPTTKAQTLTQVSGTITDPNTLKYSNAQIVIQLAGGGSTPMVTPCASSPCNIQNPQPVQADVNGHFSIALWANASITPGGTTWCFNVQEAGVAPPWGTGPQSFSSCQTISGATDDLSSALSAVAPALTPAFSGGGALPASPAGAINCSGAGSPPTAFVNCSQGPAPNDNVIVSSPSCLSVMLNCAFANWDAHYVTDATTTLNGTTVTAPDANFTGTDALGRPIAKAGEVVFVTSDTLNGSLICPQSTIATINSATSITLSTASDCSGAPQTGTGKLFWGDDDTANLNAAWADAKCGVVQMPGSVGGDTSPGGAANAFFQSALFTTSPSCVNLATFEGPSLYGAGITSTFLIATPTFNWSSCTGGAGSVACVGGVTNGHYHDFTIWGAGFSAGAAANGKTEFQLNGATRAESVDVEGWCATCATVGVQHNSENGWFVLGGSIDTGTTACETTTPQGSWQGNACDTVPVTGTSYAMRVLTGASVLSINDGFVPGGSSAATSFGLECDGACVTVGDNLAITPGASGVAGLGIGTNGIAQIYGTTDDVSGSSSASTGIYFTSTGGKAYLTGSTIKSESAGQDVFMTNANDTLFDLGGNQFTGTTHLGNSATGSWRHQEAGTCSFAATTTCVVTFSKPFGSTLTPSFQITPVNPGSVTFTVTALSSTGATITASTSTSVAVGWNAQLNLF